MEYEVSGIKIKVKMNAKLMIIDELKPIGLFLSDPWAFFGVLQEIWSGFFSFRHVK